MTKWDVAKSARHKVLTLALRWFESNHPSHAHAARFYSPFHLAARKDEKCRGSFYGFLSFSSPVHIMKVVNMRAAIEFAKEILQKKNLLITNQDKELEKKYIKEIRADIDELRFYCDCMTLDIEEVLTIATEEE